MGLGRITVAIAAVAMALFAGCGGSDSDDDQGGSAPTTTSTTTPVAYRTEVGVPIPPDAVAISMHEWKFTPTTLRVPPKAFKLAWRNDERPCAVPTCGPTDVEHDFLILANDTGLPLARTKRLLPGTSGLFVVEGLPAGTYRFICSLHNLASMNGTIEVAA